MQRGEAHVNVYKPPSGHSHCHFVLITSTHCPISDRVYAMPIINRVVKGIGAGIGLASETIAHRKEKKGKEQGEASTDTKEEQADNEIGSDLDEDELAWRLDEASEAALQSNEPDPEHGTTDKPPEYTVDGLVDSFLAHHPPPPSYTPSAGKLSAPVILPQKRPRTKSRGFVRAYAPVLAECGINQETFLEFLDSFDKSTQVRLPTIPIPAPLHRHIMTLKC